MFTYRGKQMHPQLSTVVWPSYYDFLIPKYGASLCLFWAWRRPCVDGHEMLVVGIVRQERRRLARIMSESERKQVLGHHGSSLTRREGAEVGQEPCRLPLFAHCRYPSCPFCPPPPQPPNCVSGNVLGERHKVHLVANQKLTVIHAWT